MTQRPLDWHLELLAMDHLAELERFELENRAFFASTIGDRGDEYFAHFADRLAALARENDTGRSLFSLVIDHTDRILARINLTDIDDPEITELGYRVAESAQGRGVATYGVTRLLELAAARGVRTIFAKVATTNPASRKVLEHNDFREIGPAAAPPGSGKSFIGFRRDL